MSQEDYRNLKSSQHAEIQQNSQKHPQLAQNATDVDVNTFDETSVTGTSGKFLSTNTDFLYYCQ